MEKVKDTIYRQDAIDAVISLCDDCDSDYCGYCRVNIDGGKDARKVLKDLPSARQWIPCSEKLPEDEYVLISKKPTKLSGSKWCVTIAIRMVDPRSGKIQWRDSGFDVIQDDKVLAWMPLPPRYKGDEDEREQDG